MIRKIIFYGNYFLDFYNEQNDKVQEKIEFVLDLIRNTNRIPVKFFKYIKGTNGLYEIRIRIGKNIFRIISFFDKKQIIVLLNSFQKKSQKIPKKEIESAEKLRKKYEEEKKWESKKK